VVRRSLGLSGHPKMIAPPEDLPTPEPAVHKRHIPGRRYWPILRFVLGIGVAVAVLWVLAGHRGELSSLPAVFSKLNWWWVPPAVIVELVSFVCFARMQYELLDSGGLKAPILPLLEMTFAAQSLANSLPGGTAASAVYGFRWFRRFGADDTLAAWAMVGTVISSIISLSLVSTAGLAMATGEGSSLDLIPVIIGAFLLTVAIGALFVYERPLTWVLTWAVRISRSITGRPRGDVAAQIERLIGWVTTVRLGWRQIGQIVFWGTANWLFDCACLAMMFQAVHASIPWRGLLLAYGAGQLAASLPITPGGLGAVEGSIAIALTAFGGASLKNIVDAVLMYRIISFWLILVIGWALWGNLAIQVRRGRWRRRALSTRVEAGVAIEDDVDPLPISDLDPSSAVGS
jgi:putative heme transporter